MVAPCGCRVLLDTDGKNPTRMFGRVKPDFAANQAGNPALCGGLERKAARPGPKMSMCRIYVEIALDTPATNARIPPLQDLLSEVRTGSRPPTRRALDTPSF